MRGPLGSAAGVHARPRHEQHPGVGDPVGDQGERRRALDEQAPPHARAARGHQDDALVRAVAELAPERGLVGIGAGVEVVRVPGEPEVLARPLPHVRQVRPELAVDHVLLVADHDRQVADVGVKPQVIDVLRVLLPGAPELDRFRVVAHRQHADEVGEERVGRPLELGVLVQEVVEVPALVPDPQVVALPLDHVGEGHEVGRHDLVHVPERVLGVELVVAGPALEVTALVVKQTARGVQPRAPRLDGAIGRARGQEIDGGAGVDRLQLAGDGEVALDVAEADRARQPEDAARAGAPRARAGGALRSGIAGMLCASTGWSRTKSRIRWFTLTAWRPCSTCPAPSNVTRRAPGIAATSFSACE